MKYFLSFIFKFFTYLPILILCNSCILDRENIQNSQIYLFEIEYVNHAWGYVHNGSYIDNKGNVFSYKYGFQDDPWQPKSYDYFSARELIEKYNHQRTSCDELDQSIIKERQKLISLAIEGSYSDTTNVGADMGSLSYICYIYDSDNDLYYPIILEIKGDWEYKNESEAAGTLVEWLKTICNQD